MGISLLMPEILQLSMKDSDQSKTMSRRRQLGASGTSKGNPSMLVIGVCGATDVHTAGWDYRERAEHVWRKSTVEKDTCSRENNWTIGT